MRRLSVFVATMLAVGLVAAAAPAFAEQWSTTDPRKDVDVRGLDIVSFSLKNRDRAVVAELELTADRRGTVVVALKRRTGDVLLLVSKHPIKRDGKSFVIDKKGNKIPCPRLSVVWHGAGAYVTLRMPANCMNGGNYGAVKAWALTERLDGNDVDYAPQRAGSSSLSFGKWISRG